MQNGMELLVDRITHYVRGLYANTVGRFSAEVVEFVRKLYNGLFVSVVIATILGGLFAIASFCLLGLGFSMYSSIDIDNVTFQYLFYLSLSVLILSSIGILFSYRKFSWKEDRPFGAQLPKYNPKAASDENYFNDHLSYDQRELEAKKEYEKRWVKLLQATKLITEALKELADEVPTRKAIQVKMKKHV